MLEPKVVSVKEFKYVGAISHTGEVKVPVKIFIWKLYSILDPKEMNQL